MWCVLLFREALWKDKYAKDMQLRGKLQNYFAGNPEMEETVNEKSPRPKPPTSVLDLASTPRPSTAAPRG